MADLADVLRDGVEPSLSMMISRAVQALGELGGDRIPWDEVNATTAAATQLAIYVGGEVDLGPCRACEERGEAWEWHTDGERHGVAWVYGGWRLVLARPCPACARDGKPTGRDLRPLEQAVLDAPHDLATREALAVRVDQLLAEGMEAAHGLAAWLHDLNHNLPAWLHSLDHDAFDPSPALTRALWMMCEEIETKGEADGLGDA